MTKKRLVFSFQRQGSQFSMTLSRVSNDDRKEYGPLERVIDYGYKYLCVTR